LSPPPFPPRVCNLAPAQDCLASPRGHKLLFFHIHQAIVADALQSSPHRSRFQGPQHHSDAPPMMQRLSLLLRGVPPGWRLLQPRQIGGPGRGSKAGWHRPSATPPGPTPPVWPPQLRRPGVGPAAFPPTGQTTVDHGYAETSYSCTWASHLMVGRSHITFSTNCHACAEPPCDSQKPNMLHWHTLPTQKPSIALHPHF